MKKIFVFILMSSFIMLIAGCQSNKVPDGVSPEMYKIGTEAHDIGQQYIDGKLTAASTVQKLDKLYKEADKIWDEDKSNSKDTDYIYDLFISGTIVDMEIAAEQEDQFAMLDALETLEKDMKGKAGQEEETE